MSLTNVRPYIRNTMNSLGYSEWRDALNFQNIPSTIIDGSYHIESLDYNGIKLNQADQEIESNIVLRVFFKGGRDPIDALESGIASCEEIFKELLKPSLRVGQYADGIKNVILDGIQTESVDISNDNLLEFRLSLRVLVIVKPND